ncbi:cysteine and glycine-rich protein 1 [Patella vulgata]|uniref:cysteine and glycine-rich protein 1 n=1 Tax=Patella vulgata TaxID=6465 RepID=UPI00217FD6E8|nr:cysteine and glycine-rich protein 1 [Patella vulgata]
MSWGGSEKCPRCSKSVFFAEEVRALGKKWHKMCLKCSSCNKMLDSTNCNDHDDDIFCTACHRKHFGPKGYGFAGGSSGLSMDTGRRNEITRDNVSSYDQAQSGAAIGRSTSNGNGFGGADLCPRCGCAVYMAEKVIGAGQSYHKVCFRCGNCKKGLDSTTLAVHEGDIYCRACYGKKFGPKGYGFAGGAAGLSMDTGRLHELTRDNVSHLAQAQMAPIFDSAAYRSGGDKCHQCGTNVYMAEKELASGKIFHKSCFKCAFCNKKLDSTTLCEHEDLIFCKGCYGKNFGPKGFGYGTALQHTE